MAEFHVKRGKLISCTVTVPGDKSISHRSVMIAALSNGTCVIDGFLPSEDCLSTMRAFRAMGIRIDCPAEEDLHNGAATAGGIQITVHGRRGLLTAPTVPIDCGNSGTTMRLLSGVLAAQPFRTELFGDPSLSKRPMKRVIEPLTLMGADIKSMGENSAPPLIIQGGKLQPIDYKLPVASAQVKSAILLAGLFCQGKTTVTEPLVTRDHTEKMLDYFRVKTVRNGNEISIYGGQIPESRDFTVPGDISSAAFWLVAAAAQPGSELHIKNVGLNKTRTGILQVLTRMGAQISEVVETSDGGEPIGHIVIRGTQLRATTIGGEEIPNVIDELPILAVAAALAEGRTIIKDAHELRVKETDRITAVANNLRAMGVTVRELYDGMEIEGGAQMKAPAHKLPSCGDHRIAMAFAIAGLFAEGETVIEGVECVDTSYPGFARELKRFQSHEVSEEITTPVISHMPHRDPAAAKKGLLGSLGFGGGKKDAVPANGDAPSLLPIDPPAAAGDTSAGFAAHLKTTLDTQKTDSQPVDFIVIAIDGPAASGKSSVSRLLAEKLGYVHVNSGAMFRAVTWAALSAGVSPSDQAAVAALLARIDLDCGISMGRSTILVNGQDPSSNLYHEAINNGVSAVATYPEVRTRLIDLQRDYASVANIVMEGRDIGSVVFPNTPYKYYIDASPEVRQSRRAAQGHADDLTKRDETDSTREVAPLTMADGAHFIDSSNLAIHEVVEAIIEDLKAKGLPVRLADE